MEERIVIYTAIFGSRDVLHEPKYIPKNCDFVCFTDRFFSSRIWDVRRVVPPVADDSIRSARHYKILPHRYFPEYNISVWIDGNVLITGDIRELIDTYLRDADLAGFDHVAYEKIPLHSVAEQAQALLKPGQDKRNHESFENIERQAIVYKRKGFPDNSGLLWTMTLLRRHNKPQVIKTMEDWWREIMEYSKRDQMSFNYVAWKNNFNFNYIPFDGSKNEFVHRIPHFKPWYKTIAAYYRATIRRLIRFFV